MAYKLILILILALAMQTCRRNNSHVVDVKGNVRNNCTGLPFKNVEVIFVQSKNYAIKKSTTVTKKVMTDDNGNFDFGTIECFDKDKANYFLSVPGYSNYDYELYGIDVFLKQNEIAQYHQFGISASFKILHVVFLNNYIYNTNDSIDLSFHQKILQSYEPDRIVNFGYKGLGKGINRDGFTNYFSNINNYPMGWWQITLKKYKSGIYSTTYDSVYIDMGATTTYTIHW